MAGEPGSPDVDLDWDVADFNASLPSGRDHSYFINRMWVAPIAATAKGALGRVLEVACGDARAAAKLNLLGLQSIALDPSPIMLARAGRRIAAEGARVDFVRGIAESLPFREGSFNRVLCESSLDHLADPQRAIAAMARLLEPEGRLIIGVVNYGSVNVRLSRMVYRLGRSLGFIPRDQHMFWDTPVPHEHTFECTYKILMGMGRASLELDRVHGISIGWAFPGWGQLLARLPERVAAGLLVGLDTIAYRAPRLADYILTVWKPKPFGR